MKDAEEVTRPTNIIQRGQAFPQWLISLSRRSAWDRRRCPHCGGTLTCKWGGYTRSPWFLSGRQAVWVSAIVHTLPQDLLGAVRHAHAGQLVRPGGASQDAIDHWQHAGTSLRRTAELLRSWLGRQERWLLWRPLDAGTHERCYLSASTVHRWQDGAGKIAQASVDGQLTGIGQTYPFKGCNHRLAIKYPRTSFCGRIQP